MVQNGDLTGVCIECCADLADEGSTMVVITSDPGVGIPSGDLREDLRAAQNHTCWHFRREEALHAFVGPRQVTRVKATLHFFLFHCAKKYFQMI
jgi:hypothetical protein